MRKVMLDGITSDPVAMGWMEGIPPPPEKRIDPARADHMRFPMIRYSFSNMRQFVPTVRVSRGSGPVSTFERALRDDLDGVSFTPVGADVPMTWGESLLANFTDGILVLHRGKVVYERWFGVTGPATRHMSFSVTKSFVGILAEMLVEEGRLDPEAEVASLLPELAASGFADATVRQILDMTTGVAFSETYDDPNSGIGGFSAALGLTPPPAGYSGPRDMYSFIPSVGKQGSHGEAFTYRTVNTEVLGWIVARTEGRRLHLSLSERMWQPLGMEGDADLIVDRAGTPFAGGGLCLTLADLARLGEAMRLGGAGAIPAKVVARILAGGNPALFPAETYPCLPGWSYRSQWWVSGTGAFAARGINGQALYVDPAAEMTIARFGSHPVAANTVNDPVSQPAFRAMAARLGA